MKLLKKILFICLLIASIFPNYDINTSEQNSNSAIYFNFLGQNPVFSLNYDRHIINKQLSAFSGVGVYPGYLSVFLTIPLGFNLLFGDRHFAEIGVAGLSLLELNRNNKLDFNAYELIPNFSFGYRYQTKKKLFFKLYLTTFINDEVTLFPGISLGASL